VTLTAIKEVAYFPLQFTKQAASQTPARKRIYGKKKRRKTKDRQYFGLVRARGNSPFLFFELPF